MEIIHNKLLYNTIQNRFKKLTGKAIRIYDKTGDCFLQSGDRYMFQWKFSDKKELCHKINKYLNERR